MSETTEVAVTAVTTQDDQASDLPLANMTLIAESPDQLQREQKRLIAWCEAKQREVSATIADLETSIAHHRKLKWGYGPLRAALTRETERLMFYDKVQAALEAGFYIVPNFPCDVFAIRTWHEADVPHMESTNAQSAIRNLSNADADTLPAGEGEYQNPRVTGQIVSRYDRKKTYPVNSAETERVFVAAALDYRKMEFPFAFAKPEVLTATHAAMTLKIFDELGVLPGRKRNVDPMIIGRIIRPWQRKKWNSDSNQQRHLSFIVVWWLDTATI